MAADSHDRVAVVLVLELGFDSVAVKRAVAASDWEPVAATPGLAVDAVLAGR